MTRRVAWSAGLVLLLAASMTMLQVGRPGRPEVRLAVLLVVDQLRADYLERFQDRYEGGFEWLLEHGARFTNAAYRHAVTVTAAGHATVATGLHPSSHGIVGNSWREPGRGSVYCIEDAQYAPVGGPAGNVSPRALRADTLGDRLKAKYPGSRVYSFSTKDRSAVLMAGRSADGAFWFEPECGCFASSSYYGDALPAWLAEFNASRPASAYAGMDWTKLLPDDGLYERMSREDAFVGERDDGGTSFPHGRPVEGFEGTLAATPFSDALTLGAAHAALASGELGRDESPDLLALGLSATDSVGHRYGPFSQEAMDNHLRLDRQLGEFLKALDEAVGLRHVVFALTADHGAVPLVEHLAAGGVTAERFDTAGFWKRAETEIERCSGGPASETVDSASGTRLYWDEQALQRRGRGRGAASECLAEWLGEQRGVESALTAEQLASGALEGVARLFQNSYFPSRSAHIQLHLKEYFYPGGETGTGHGSAHGYDRKVPVLLAGSRIRRGRYDSPEVGPDDIAPALCKLLGLPGEWSRETVPLQPGLDLTGAE